MAETMKEAMERVRQDAPLRTWCEQNLTPMGRTFVCPNPKCKSGTGKNHTPAFSLNSDGAHWRCFSCGASGDVFDLAGIVHGTEDKAEQVRIVAEWAGVEGWGSAARGHESAPVAFGWNDTVQTADEPATAPQPPVAAPQPADYSEGRERHAQYIHDCQKRITDPRAVAYLQARGIDLDTAQAFGLGYDPEAGGAKDESGAWCERGRVIIPWPGAPWYHIDRSTDPRAKAAKYHKPKSTEVGPQPLWNPEAFKGAEPVFVVEGPLDALAIQACGHPAVALGGTSDGNSELVAAIKAQRKPPVVVLMLDNDLPDKDGKRPGQDHQRELAAQLEAAGVEYSEAHLEDIAHNDAAEAFADSPEVLRQSLAAWAEIAEGERAQRRAERYAAVLKGLHVVDAAEVAAGICEFSDPVIPIPTGFSRLDRVLGGGLQPKNVHVFGGGTSMGKTTYALQIADHICEEGHHVLFVNIEQRANELVAKSLSRILASVPDEHGRTYEATARQLTNYWERTAWSRDEANRAALAHAQAHYRERIAPYMHYVEAQEQPTVEGVRMIVETMAQQTGEAPCIFIDYLQLLASENPRETDEKAILKRNMVALRQMAGGYNVPVFVLAALSRDGMLQPMETNSFRDSSNIEYSSDVLMGLQLRNAKKRVAEVDEKHRKYLMATWADEEKDKQYRELETVIIKNRAGDTQNGIAGGVYTTFEPRFNRFSEDGFALQ